MTRNLENDQGELVEAVEIPEKQSREESSLEELLGILRPNTTIVIERLQPTWCDGFLEEVTLTEQIGIEYFKETWGGQLLSVKVRGKQGRFSSGSYRVPLFSYHPLVYGERIYKNDFKKPAESKSESIDVSGNSSPVVVNPGNPFDKLFSALPAVLPLVLEWMKNQEEKRQAELQTMLQIARSNSGGGLSDITKVGAVMGQLQTMFQNQAGNAGGGGGELDFLPHALDVLKMVMTPNNNAPSGAPAPGVPPAPQLRSPKKSVPPPAAPVKAQPPQNVTPLNNENFGNMDSRELSDDLAELDPEECIDTVLDALDRMPDDKRGKTIANFLKVYQEDMQGEFEKFLNGNDDEKKNRGAQ